MDTKRYEAVLVLVPELDEAGVKAQIEKVEATITAHGGTLEQQDIWGRRELSYRVKKKSFGVYVVLVFSGDNRLVADLERQLRINESCLRHLVVAKDKHAPDLTPERREESLGMAVSASPVPAEEEAFQAGGEQVQP